MDEFKIDLGQAEEWIGPYIPPKFTHGGGLGTFDTLPVYTLNGYTIGEQVTSRGGTLMTSGGKPLSIVCFIIYKDMHSAGMSNGGIIKLDEWKPWKNT